VAVNDSFPPMRELHPDRIAQRKQHLLGEIAQTPASVPRVSSRALLAAAALAVAAVGVFAVARGGTDTASAAQVRAKIAQGLQFAESVRGEITVRTQEPGARPRGVPGCQNCTPPVSLPTRFVVGADGSFASLRLPLDAAERHDIAYNASTGVETSAGSFLDPRSGVPLYIRASNLDPAAPPTYGPEARLAIWVKGALANRDSRVRETTFEGRAAWELSVRFSPGVARYDAYGARIDVVVDRTTGLVLQVTQYAYDTERWTSIQTIRKLKVGEPTIPADFTVPRPSGAREVAWDHGFRRVTVSDAATIAGYRPLLPTDTGGRSLGDFAVAKTENVPFPGFPVYHDVVSARYGTGLDAVTVSTRRGTEDELPGLLSGADTRTIHVQQGPLVGEPGFVTTSPLERALLVAYHDGLVVQVSAPSGAEAIAVANSLRRAVS
jgi:hypothetical protein